MSKLASLMFAFEIAGAALVVTPVAHADTQGSTAASTGQAPAVSVPAGEPNGLSPTQLRQRCVDAMNADPTFASSIVATVDRQIDNKTLAAHVDADYHVRKNERHVIYAYAAMWVIAVAFVWFLYRRQVALETEIAMLRRDLEAAGKDAT